MRGHLRLSLGLICAVAMLGAGISDAQAASCPNLVILLDQSASMTRTPAGAIPQTGEKSKWDIAVAALTNVINKYDGLLPLGYSNFPYRNASCDTRGFYVDTAYQRDCTVGYGTKQSIYDAMHIFPTQAPWSGGSTPTCTAISKLAAEMKLQDAARSQYILLVTDGAPEVSCCPGDPVQATVDAITAARMQTPSIKTIVVGFGVVASEHAALESMATAGGLPDSDPQHKFYLASDAASLDAKLAEILHELVGGDAGAPVLCEDGCYGEAGCPSGQVCIQNACQTNSCSGKGCDNSQHCLFDGKTSNCVADCLQPCPNGARCDNGRCVEDACGGPCQPAQKCDTATSRCVADSKCDNVICHSSQACYDGKCVDDPCRYTTCSAGTQCIPYSGQCMPPRDPSLSNGQDGGGCSCELGGRRYAASATQFGALGAIAALLLFGRLARRRHRTVTR